MSKKSKKGGWRKRPVGSRVSRVVVPIDPEIAKQSVHIKAGTNDDASLTVKKSETNPGDKQHDEEE